MATEIDKLIDSEYIPTEVERKRAVMMYFLIGILLSIISNKKMTLYERFHFKQALWWWMIFFTFLIIFTFFFFIPYIRLIPILFFFILLAVWIYFVYQAWNWYYVNDEKKIVMPFFYWLWWWVYSIFNLDKEDWKRDFTK